MKHLSGAATAFLLLCSLAPFELGAKPASSNDAMSLILLQINNDMHYGADEYFGDSRDLLYVDQTKPEIKKVVAVSATPAVNSQSSGNNSNSNKEDKDTTVASNSSANSSGSSPSAPSTPDTPPVGPDLPPITIDPPPGGG